MDLAEYKSKELFLKYGISCTYGVIADSINELRNKSGEIIYPAVLKAQVQTGGRGKAGGIKFAENEEELFYHAEKIYGLDIKGHTVKKIMVTYAQPIEKELYLAVILDRTERCPVILYCENGGMDIEAHPELVKRVPVNPLIGVCDFTTRYLSRSKALSELIIKLYKLFCEYDCLLCEINPLAVTSDGQLIAVDGKITIDDSALKRHTDIAEYVNNSEHNPLSSEAEKYNFLYIPCDDKGDIAVMSNGSGMLMSCIDMITENHMTVRATLDLGGGATADRITEAIRIIMSDHNTRQLFINIFGGITRCDEVAHGIRAAISKYNIEKRIIIRLEGTNKLKGLEILNGLTGVVNVDGLSEGVGALKNEYIN